MTTSALWMTGPGQVACRDTGYEIGPDDLDIQALFSGISRGTERLVFQGRVPPSEHDTMRAPHQEGEFTFPIKYGYSTVGRVQSGPRAGDVVFALFPHQARFALPADAVIRVPANVPPQRAILASNMETALNVLWDARLTAGDKVVVVGCGVIGALVAYLANRMPGTEVCAIDVNPSRAKLMEKLGVRFETPATANGNNDVAIHTSASAKGLATAIDLAGTEAKVVEASWYGDGLTETPLGGGFHQRRLQIIGSQVGRIPAHQAARWTYRRRLEKALSLLGDPAVDALLSGETDFADISKQYAEILEDPATLCHRIRYGD